MLAIAAAGYVFLAAPSDRPSDWQHFLGSVDRAGDVALFLDARGADSQATTKIYQCGADIILSGRELFGRKNVVTFACDDTGCATAQSAANASGTLTAQQVQLKLSGQPYILVKKGAPDTRIFERHVEISIDGNYSEGCSFKVTMGK